MKQVIKFIMGLLAPFILVFGGAGIAGLGIEYDNNVLFWAGGITILCGLLWGLWLYFLSGYDLFD